MAQAALATTPPELIDVEVQEALALCKGDALMALRITLIANAFLDARIDQLEAKVSAGFARRKPQPRPQSGAVEK
jgi:hypothetical protein